jgi:hypothetical protein
MNFLSKRSYSRTTTPCFNQMDINGSTGSYTKTSIRISLFQYNIQFDVIAL